MAQLRTGEVELIYNKAADHQYSDPSSLQTLISAVQRMMDKTK